MPSTLTDDEHVVILVFVMGDAPIKSLRDTHRLNYNESHTCPIVMIMSHDIVHEKRVWKEGTEDGERRKGRRVMP